MKIRQFKKLVPFAIFLLTLASVSSCNRGVGCPNNFSMDTTTVVETACDVAVELFIKD